MPLEDLTGPDKYLDALVPTNPEGGDPKAEGDDHIRGIKNVLGNTFPGVDQAYDLADLTARIEALEGAGSGWQFLERRSIQSAVATVEFGFKPSHDYEFKFERLKPVSDGVQLTLEISTDDGVSWVADGQYYDSALWFRSTGADGSQSTDNTLCVIPRGASSPRFSSGANFRVQGRLTFFAPNASTAPYFTYEGQFGGMETGGTAYVTTVAGGWHDGARVTNVRLGFNVGDMDDGEIVVHERKTY